MATTNLMPTKMRVLAAVIFVTAISQSQVSAEGQLGAALELIPVPGADGHYFLTQKTKDQRLILTPNEAFFPRLGLKAVGQSVVPDVGKLNGDQSLAQISGWDEGDVAEWGLWLPKRGEIQASVDTSGGGHFSISLNAHNRTDVSRKPTTISIDRPGKHVLRLHCLHADRDTIVQRVTVTGAAARDAAVIRKRWRPAAAHTKFHSSHDPKSVRLWIMEMDAVPGELGFYSPITTPFGYYGPSWNADGTVGSKFNFSLWSYGRNQPEPPLRELSHLIAIGNPDASFDGFGHEGTGVKIRDWEPLARRQGQRQAIALRVEPGETYDTYHSYFYAADEHRWRLFGSGNKFNKGKPLQSLWVGSFVEVPGPPPVQRTGAYPRRMRYRGWVMDANAKWYSLDRMAAGDVDRDTGLTHTNRGVTDDGWFYLETGGWTLRKPPSGGNDIELPESLAAKNLEYLSAEKLRTLMMVPCEIAVTGVGRGKVTNLKFNVRGAGNHPEVTVYWGSDEGLTFADRWQHSTRINHVVDGANFWTLPKVGEGEALYVRLLLKNEQGQFWSRETHKVR